MRVVVTGGALGGHLVPLEPIIDTLRTVYSEQRSRLPVMIEGNKFDIYFLGILNKDTKTFFKRLSVKAVHIPSGKLRRYPSSRTVVDLLFRLPWGILVALLQMWRIMPDVVISKGGYGSLPVAAAAVFYRIPFLLHESDASMGLANRIMAGWSSVITVGFAATRQNIRFYRAKTVVTGTPVRSQLVTVNQEQAKQMFGFAPDVPILLVMGGSQGAQQINEVLIQVLPSLLADMGIIHLTGPDKLAAVRQEVQLVLKKTSGEVRALYKPFGYLTERLGNAMAAADVVVTRAGATSLAELARFRKATIIVPLDLAAQDHQRRNAAVFEAAQAARVMDPANLGRALFEQNVRDLMGDAELRKTLENNIGQLDRPQAGREIALLAFKLAQGLVPRQQDKPSQARVTARQK